MAYTKILLRCFLAFLLGSYLLLFVNSAISGERAVMIPLEKMQVIERMLERQAAEINSLTNEAYYWSTKHRDLSLCIREAARTNTPATTCLGDTES